jgi:chemotaxis protein CheZ
MFGGAVMTENTKTSEEQADSVKAEGPIIDAANREDVASDQDDVDDLLSSLGF